MRFRFLSALAALLLVMPGISYALGLGEIQLKSTLNAPLSAEIELFATDDELVDLQARMASQGHLHALRARLPGFPGERAGPDRAPGEWAQRHPAHYHRADHRALCDFPRGSQRGTGSYPARIYGAVRSAGLCSAAGGPGPACGRPDSWGQWRQPDLPGAPVRHPHRQRLRPRGQLLLRRLQRLVVVTRCRVVIRSLPSLSVTTVRVQSGRR